MSCRRGAIVFLLSLGGCSRSSAPAPGPSPSASASPAPASATLSAASAAIDPILGFDACTLGHRGMLLDLGDKSSRARFDPRLAPGDVESVEREGATWTRIRARSVSMKFFATGPADGDDPNRAGEATFVEARVRGGLARSISVYLNGKPVGLWALGKGEAHTVNARAGGSLLLAGENELSMRMNGPRSPGDVLAEIDWVHIGVGEPDPIYAAPTRGDVLTNATLDGKAKQALSVRAPGFVRCSGWIPSGASVENSVGISGAGEADVEVRILRDRAPPLVVQKTHVVGGEHSAWQSTTTPLGDLGAKLGVVGAFELAVVRAAKGTRVLFGEPRVMAPRAAAPPVIPPSRGVILVVLGQIQRRSLKLYGGDIATPALASLAEGGVIFEAHRSSSTLPNGALASMLTGIGAHAARMDDVEARLPASLTTVADAARQAGVVTAMFTANPMTSATYGFQRSWETFVAHSPLEETPAVAVFDEAARWIEAHKAERFLVLIHARGGHPPWDAATDDIKALPPTNYVGGLDPSHAAELLSKARHVPPLMRFNDADRARAWALYALAVRTHDTALGRLEGAVRAAGREGDTTFLVTGDLGVSGTRVPFGDGEPPEEDLLSIPLVVRTGAHALAGTRTALPTSDIDIARTVTSSLGLIPSSYFQGVDLLGTASGTFAPGGRPLLATSAEHFSLAWGTLVWSGTAKREQLCDILLEPACVTDVRASYPLAVETLRRAAFDRSHADESGGALGRAAGASVKREPITLDPPASAMLRAWGR